MLFLHQNKVKEFINKCAVALFLDYHPHIKFNEYIKEDEFSAFINNKKVTVGLLKNLKNGNKNSFFSSYTEEKEFIKGEKNDNNFYRINMSENFIIEYEKYSFNSYEYIVKNFFEKKWQERYPKLFNYSYEHKASQLLYKYKKFPECEPTALSQTCNTCMSKCNNPSMWHNRFQEFIDGTLVFSNPNEFNDPFDCDCEIPLINLSKLFSLSIARKRLEEKFPYIHDFIITDVLQRENQSINVVDFDRNLIYNIIYKIIDEECKLYGVDNSSFSKIIDGIVNVFQQLLSQIKDIKDNFRVLCLAKTYNDILMWGYYGNSGNGLCCEYNKDEIVHSTEKEIQNINCICIYGNVHYSEDKPTYKGKHLSGVNNLFEYIVNCVFTKSKIWKHEGEYRYVLLFENPSKGPFLVKNTKINRIYQGYSQGCHTNLYNIQKHNTFILKKDEKKYELKCK